MNRFIMKAFMMKKGLAGLMNRLVSDPWQRIIVSLVTLTDTQ